MLWEIVTRQLPFESIRFNSQIEDFVKGGHRPAIPDTLNLDLELLIETCWHQGPEERPPIDEIVQQLELFNQALPMPRGSDGAEDQIVRLDLETDFEEASLLLIK